MSMGILLGLLNLIIEGDFKQYFINIKSNRFFIAVFVFYVLHILGLLWTNDIISGLDDLKSKATIVVVPLIVIARPIVLRKSYKFLIIVFLLGLLVTSVINFTVYHFFESSFDFKMRVICHYSILTFVMQ
jgi:O-antigen ligase